MTTSPAQGKSNPKKLTPEKKRTRAAPRKLSGNPSSTQKSSHVNAEGGVRLNVFLQSHGVASRRKADDLISRGQVKVNGKVTTVLGLKIEPDSIVAVDGKIIKSEPPAMTVLLNKPDLCLTTRLDTQGRTTIFDLPALKGLPTNVQAVGRLDYRSEGLLLLTNDGDLAFALTHPRFSVEKTYAILVADDVTIEDVEKLRSGIKLEDGMAKAISVRMGSKEKMGSSRGQWIEIVVTEGRNRLIRRMAEALGLKVVRLVRTALGDLKIPARLSSGQLTTVNAQDLIYLKKIKEEMLVNRGRSVDLSETGLTPQDLRKRKIKRTLNLNDTEYTDEVQRRSAEAGAKRRARTGGKPNTIKPKSPELPVAKINPAQNRSSELMNVEKKPKKSADKNPRSPKK